VLAPLAAQPGRVNVSRQGNAFCERRRAWVVFWLALACVVVVIRRLVRCVWTSYRWDGRPRRRP
jgi:uncharacterized membrane-anchored protein